MAYDDYEKVFELDEYTKQHNCMLKKNGNGELFMSVIVGADNNTGKACYVYVLLFPRTAWLVSKYVLGISATLMFTWVLVSEIKAHRRKKSVQIPSEQEEETE